MRKHGLAPVAGGSVVNTTHLDMSPVASAAGPGKERPAAGARPDPVGRLPVVLPLGNLWVAGRKPLRCSCSLPRADLHCFERSLGKASRSRSRGQ